MRAEDQKLSFGKYRAAVSGGGIDIFYLGGEKERLVLALPPDFVVARRSVLRSKPAQGMPNLSHSVKQELRSTADFETSASENSATLKGRLGEHGWTLTLEARGEGLHLALTAPGFDEVGLCFRRSQREAFMGFGEQFSHLDMSGKAFTLCTGEQGIGRGIQPLSFIINRFSKGAAGDAFTTYAPMPVFVTTENRALAFDEDSIYWCDIGRKRRELCTITLWGETVSATLFGGEGMLELIEKHTAVTGRLPAMPDFAFGSILGVRGGRDVAERVLEESLSHGAPVTALWVEDWQGRRGKNGGPPLWWRWYPDEKLYPDFKNWVAGLKARGIAVMGYANTFLSVDEGNSLYVEGRENDYFVKNPDGSDLISSFFTGKEYKYVIVDLTNPSAYDWLKARMKTGMVENGLSGWMADYGEYLPIGSKTFGGDSVQAHCRLPVLWAKLNAELIEECGKKGEILAFHRSGGTGSNRYAAVYWAGDQNPTFDAYDGLASSIVALISGGISGMSVNHTDIGGFTSLITPAFKLVRKKEVLLRWLEYSAFTPVFRTHDGSYANPLNYQFYYDEEGYAAYAKFGRVHAVLKWYFLELQRESVERGRPMVRALCLHYPECAECVSIKDQYLLGEDLLVSPVYAAKAKDRPAFLPPGEWICPHSGKRYSGGVRLRLPAPLGKPPVLVRAASQNAERLLETLREVL